jgi:hypothetical protein
MTDQEHSWGHDELADDLAQYLRSPERMVWANMQLGPSGSPRPDVFTLQKSYSKPAPAAFEVKISRRDLRSDTTSGKWQTYLRYAQSVTFAVPDGLCTVADIPKECGLIMRKAAVWRYMRKPMLTPVNMPFDACMKLLIDGVSRTVGNRLLQPRRAAAWLENEAVRKKFGEAVATTARDLTVARQQVEDLGSVARTEYAAMRARVKARETHLMSVANEEMAVWNTIKAEVLDWLGIDGTPSSFEVRRRLRNIREQADVDARIIAVDRRLEAVQRSLEQALQTLTA